MCNKCMLVVYFLHCCTCKRIRQTLGESGYTTEQEYGMVRVIVFNITFYNISVMSWRSVVLKYLEKTTDLTNFIT